MLVRMMKDGQPKYVRATDIVDIGWADDDHECGACTVTYKDGGFAVVDGSPDEVFKALFNPPESIDKADVDREIRLSSHLSPTQMEAVRFGLGISSEPRLDTLIGTLKGLRDRLGLPPEKY